MLIQRLLTLLLIIIVVYLLYSYFSDSNKTKLSSVTDGKKEVTISSGKLATGDSDNYTYSIWLYINDWDYRYGEEKIVFGKTDGKLKPSPSVVLDSTINDLIVKISVGDNSSIVSTRVQNVPIQSWFNVIVSVNSRVLDVYLDGKLVRTQLLSGVPSTPTTSPIHLTPDGGFSGQTSRFEYLAYAVNPSEAYDIYKNGSGTGSLLGSLFNRYRVKIAFMEDNTETSSLEI
jgi:hypothetical protein